MSSSHSRRRSPPALSEDDIVAVFLRIPPDEPALLIRASLVCKAWRRTLTDPQFCRLYREFHFHGTQPMLGFVLNFRSRNTGELSRFVPTTAFRPLATTAAVDTYPRNWKAVDSRHGRVLVEPVAGHHGLLATGYIVWDPITNGRWGVPPFPAIHRLSRTAAVLCAKQHCDHLGCHGPPFLVATVSSDSGTTSVCVYSSESGVWSDVITLNHPNFIDRCGRSILVGNTLHFPFQDSLSVLQYNLGEQKLSVIDMPPAPIWDEDERLVFVSAAEDGVMVFAGLRGKKLLFWSAQAGALSWTKSRVIKLKKKLPRAAFDPYLHPAYERYEFKPTVSGFAEGVVFLSTMAGLFTVELNSGRTKKVADVDMAHNVVPWISFYTQDHARRMMH